MEIGRVCLPTMFRVKSPAFHQEMCDDFVDDNITRMCYDAPRGHAKTTIVGKLLPLHHIFYGGNNRLIVPISRTQGHAIKICNSIKSNLEHNKMLRAIFGDYGRTTARKWADTETILKNGTAIIPVGSGQQIRGMFSDDYRPTLLLLDDIEDKENTRTRDAMDATLEWFLAEVLQSLDPQVGRVFVIGTVVAADCVVDKLRHMPNWLSRKWQAIPGWDGNIKPGEIPKVLWPEWWPFERLMEEKETMKYAGKESLWWREFQGEIHTQAESLADTSKWKHIIDYSIKDTGKDFRLLGVEYANHEIESNIPVHVFGGVDPAASVLDGNDFSVIFDLARAADRDFAFDMLRGRIKPLSLADELIQRHKRYRYNGVNIESVGFQQMIADYIKTTNVHIPGIHRTNNPRHRKDERLRSLEGPLSKSGFHFNSRVMSSFVDEANKFPRGRHDDTLDGCWYAYKNSYPCLADYAGADNTPEKTKPRGRVMSGINWLTGVKYGD
jgi:hypothetical protein